MHKFYKHSQQTNSQFFQELFHNYQFHLTIFWCFHCTHAAVLSQYCILYFKLTQKCQVLWQYFWEQHFRQQPICIKCRFSSSNNFLCLMPVFNVAAQCIMYSIINSPTDKNCTHILNFKRILLHMTHYTHSMKYTCRNRWQLHWNVSVTFHHSLNRLTLNYLPVSLACGGNQLGCCGSFF
jgi:hypothetical protein